MATLKAQKIRGALQKARNVGRAEETVTIDGCTFVLQSMPSEHYDAILKEVGDLEGAEYMHEYQNGYLCRAIVEIEGIDLRDVDFVEDDVPAGNFTLNAVVPTETKAKKAKEELAKLGINLVVMPPDGSEGDRTALIERHEWIRKSIKTWSQEAVAIAWRKYADVVKAGEQRARDKVEFRLPDETPEDKYRRLLSEAKALESELPPEMLANILGDSGYLLKTSSVELETAAQRLGNLAPQEVQGILEEPEEAPPETVAEPIRPAVTPESLAQKIRNRTPLNRMSEPSQEDQIEAARPTTKAAQIAALEELDFVESSALPRVNRDQMEVAELRPRAPIDGGAVRHIIDAPPVVGINPRYRPPNNG